jgi:hypothetical protein
VELSTKREVIMRITPVSVGKQQPENHVNTVSVFEESVRFGKPASVVLDLPKNSLVFDFDEETKTLYVVKENGGFKISQSVHCCFIHNRKLCRMLLVSFKATKRVTFHLQNIPCERGYELKAVSQE